MVPRTLPFPWDNNGRVQIPAQGVETRPISSDVSSLTDGEGQGKRSHDHADSEKAVVLRGAGGG
jgi:hypothetical protein